MKIWLYIMLTVIAILLVVGIALEIFFRHYVANETLRNATRDTTSVSYTHLRAHET